MASRRKRVRIAAPPQNDVLARKTAEIERQAMEQAMRDGYIAAAREHNELSRDWETIDLEDWPD